MNHQKAMLVNGIRFKAKEGLRMVDDLRSRS